MSENNQENTPRTKESAPPASLVPVQPTTISSRDKTTKRLVVVLSQACLETHKMNFF